MPYKTKLKSIALDDDWNQITEDLVFESLWFKITRIAKRNLVTDFSSVPRVPILYLLFGGRGKRPATNHDDDYAKQELPKWKVDLLFFEGLISTFVMEAWETVFRCDFAIDRVKWFIKTIWRLFISFLMYLGVVTGGYPTWWRYSYRRKRGLPLRPEAPPPILDDEQDTIF